MRFLIDAQLPPRLVQQFIEAGYEARHVVDFGLLQAADREIWNKAVELDAALVSKDADFVTLRALRGGPPIVWIRFGNATRRVLAEKMKRALPDIVAAIRHGEGVVVVE